VACPMLAPAVNVTLVPTGGEITPVPRLTQVCMLPAPKQAWRFWELLLWAMERAHMDR
jgi:hypothetical protein